ncbi:LysR family transcriptional regulator [Parasediminibacterium sp. JCM 36343]|uniref:LysR family transcriptional regulator n=1 Tax=Parasediminibacterium sp. JCM 36343 TaxID=3374279 RepID=UPI00397D6BE7
MELRHLRYFLALAEELSFIKASEKLFISQPPLSRQIKELEDELNARLFDRNNKRVQLTEAGKYFEKEVRQLLQNLDNIALKTQKISKSVSGEFRIAYISSTFSGDIAELIKFLSDKYPFVNFRLYEMPTASQIASLEQGEIDLGIIRAPLYSPKIKGTPWFRDSFSVVFNKQKINLASEDEIGKLKEETFVFFNKEYAPNYYNSLLEICAFYGFIPKVVHEANNISSIIQLVKNGLGTSIVPTNILKSHNYPELGFIELKKVNLFTEILLATPQGDDSEIANEAIAFLLHW